MKLNKKGVIEVQFNWIYIAVAGAIILLIFGSIALGIKKSAKEKLEYEAINYFDNIFTSMQASENTEHSVVLPGMEIEIDTPEREEDVENCNYYRIKGSSMQGKSIEFIPIFSPATASKRVLSFSLGWDSPFRANYFLYLTSPDIAYAVVGDNDMLMEDLPNHLTKKNIDAVYELKDQSYYAIRFILLNEEPTSVSSSVAKMKNSLVSAVNIKPRGNLYDGGRITFYSKKGPSFIEEKTVDYNDKATLIAAIYSETAYSYECNLRKAIKRLNLVAGILKSRANIIKNSDLLPMCSLSYYDQAYNLLERLEQATEDNTNINIGGMDSIKKELDILNENINMGSCPTIY